MFVCPILNTFNLAQDMQVVGSDPKRTSTSPAWRQLKHRSKIITFMGIASIYNCDPVTQIITAKIDACGATLYIPLGTLLHDLRKRKDIVNQEALELSIVAFDKHVLKLRTNTLAAMAVLKSGVVKRRLGENILLVNGDGSASQGSTKKQRTSKARQAAAAAATTTTTMTTASNDGAAASGAKRKKGSSGNAKRELVCNVCSKKFRLQHNLRAHTRTHTGEKPFLCKHPGCGKRFNHGGNLLKHERRHIPYNQRPYPCDVAGCTKRFMENCDLRTHKKSHNMKRSSFRGVTIERGRWKAQIGYDGKTHHIGTYDTDAEAAKAYDLEAIRVHGVKALCNFSS